MFRAKGLELQVLRVLGLVRAGWRLAVVGWLRAVARFLLFPARFQFPPGSVAVGSLGGGLGAGSIPGNFPEGFGMGGYGPAAGMGAYMSQMPVHMMGPYPNANVNNMEVLLNEIRGVIANVNSKFVSLTAKISEIKIELAQIKIQMVTKEEHNSLVDRVAKLEAGGGGQGGQGGPEVKALQMQLDR